MPVVILNPTLQFKLPLFTFKGPPLTVAYCLIGTQMPFCWLASPSDESRIRSKIRPIRLDNTQPGCDCSFPPLPSPPPTPHNCELQQQLHESPQQPKTTSNNITNRPTHDFSLLITDKLTEKNGPQRKEGRAQGREHFSRSSDP